MNLANRICLIHPSIKGREANCGSFYGYSKKSLKNADIAYSLKPFQAVW